MITTIQLSKNAKDSLAKLRTSNKQTYEDIVLGLIKLAETEKRKQEKLMIEGCREMSEENLKITEEFESAEDLSKWEWDEN